MIHQTLETLPWNSFVPSLADLELLVRATGQFLPEVHSFLVSIIVRCPLSCLVNQWKQQPTGCTRLLSCLLHLYVRLAGEPTAQQVVGINLFIPSQSNNLLFYFLLEYNNLEARFGRSNHIPLAVYRCQYLRPSLKLVSIY